MSPPPYWVVSMTTLPERFGTPFFEQVIQSLLHQQCSFPFEIVVWVPTSSHRFPDLSYADWTLDHPRLKIKHCEDMGPATKLLGNFTDPAFPLHPSWSRCTHLLLVDDDIIVRPDAFENMYRVIRQDIQHVWTNHWESPFSKKRIPPQGFAGVLIPFSWIRSISHRPSFHSFLKTMQNPQHPCYKVDDTILDHLFRITSIPVKSTGLHPFRQWMDRQETDRHPPWLELCKDGDRVSLTRSCIQCLSLSLPQL